MIINKKSRSQIKHDLCLEYERQGKFLFESPRFRFMESNLYRNHFHLYSDTRFTKPMLDIVAATHHIHYVGFLLSNTSLKYCYIFKVFDEHYESENYIYG